MVTVNFYGSPTCLFTSFKDVCLTIMSALKNQELADDFFADPLHVGKLLLVDDLDLLSMYNDQTGVYPIGRHAHQITRRYVRRYIGSIANKNVTMGIVDDVVDQVKVQMDRRVRTIHSPYIAFADCLLNFITFKPEPFSPDKVCFWKVPFTYESVMSAPDPVQFFSFLNDVIVEEDTILPDRTTQTVVQEMFGYCFAPTNKAEAAFFLVGDGSNGKSVLLNILRAVIGIENCSAKSIETLTTNRFAASGLIGKVVNICTEEESKFLKSDKFKSFISGEETDVERKFGGAFETKFNIKFLFSTNDSPSFEGYNWGLFRRLLVIPLTRKIDAAMRDPYITERIIASELCGILKWALAGTKKLIASKFTFTESSATKLALSTVKSSLSSAALYVTENYVDDAEAFIGCDALYEDYENWCKARGKKTVAFYKFFQDIKQVCTIPLPKNPQWSDGKMIRGRFLRRKTGAWGEDLDPAGGQEALL